MAVLLCTAFIIGLSSCGVLEQEVEKSEGVYYEIFVRSFADSNGDGIGDINGITENLDYLDELGVTGLWLTPFNPSPSYHKYDVTNYYDVDPEYGTVEDVQRLIDEAHKRDISVIMDLVINHTSSKHPWFKEASSTTDSSYKDYYNWASLEKGDINLKTRVWGHPVWIKNKEDYYYALFWDQMPDLNYNSEAVRNDVKDIAKFWLELGVDGFRCDAAMHIFAPGEEPNGTNIRQATLDWWNEFKTYCQGINDEVILVGEVWTDPKGIAPYYESFDMLFNFSVGEDYLIPMINTGTDKSGKNNKFVDDLYSALQTFETTSSEYIDAPFLSNHDQNRVMGRLGNNVKQAKLAASIYLTLQGTPYIYYGEEIGMLGNKPDEQIREPFIWGEESDYQTSWEPLTYNNETVSAEEQQLDEDSLYNHYREMIDLRLNNEALYAGRFSPLHTDRPEVIAYQMTSKNQSIVVLHNLSEEVQDILLHEEVDLKVEDILYRNVAEESTSRIQPLSTTIIEVK